MVLRANHIAIGYETKCDEWVIQSLYLSLCGDYSPPYGGGAGGGACLLCFYFFLINVNPSRRGQYNLLYTVVFGNEVIELSDTNRLMVVVVGWVNDVPIPQCIVSEDIATRTDDGQQLLIYLRIITLVTMTKAISNRIPNFGASSAASPNTKVYLVGNWRPFNPRTGEILHLVIDFKGIEFAPFL